ncbi:hypothetical protein CKW39_10660 [Kocuria sp. WRN011]|uniref:winged helix-turn-helix domain-containing protein n=1 Tax=Kocuria sp. WRN011 TaxID=2029858 RepID=UPI000BAEE2B5|nr:winged helix-turn-helix domain-containing protein [Kocuria sp. WRN011]PBB08253.1 hypothetical protein CKW39_10660 [Kocuria sp. WRN011]
MAGTVEILRSTLGEKGYAALLAVAGHAEPMSRRAIASELKVSPTTASTWLGRLEAKGLVQSNRSGQFMMWQLNMDSDVIRAWSRERLGAGSAAVAEAGSSPVSTGGGGVTFERKVAAGYLAQLLLGSGAVGLGPSRAVVSVAFQQAPEFSVDDLVVGAATEDDDEPSLVLAVAARRTPNVVDSDVKSQGLFRSYVKQLLNMPADGPELRLALAVAGPQDHAEQLAVLAGLAADQPETKAFFGLVRTPRKFDRPVRDRLEQVEKLVRRGLVDLGVSEPSTSVVEQQTWELLSRLVVLMPRVESADDPDWSMLANSLTPVSRAKDLFGGTLLRDRLLVLADDWAPSAALVNLPMLRRGIHDLVDPTARRHQAGWRALELLNEQARAAVSDEIVSADGARRIRVDRGDVATDLSAAVVSAGGVVMHGESGVGKSAAALGLLTATNTAVADDEPKPTDGLAGSAGAGEPAGGSQVMCMNLRHLPGTALDFESALKVPLRQLLAEMSAPTRVLVVDGADAVVEGAQNLLTYVVDAAVAADVTVVAVTASEAKQLVVDTMAGRVGQGVVEVTVPPLTDPQVDVVVREFGELEPMATNPRSRELLRRPVVVDLLVRGGLQGVPVSDFDAMQQVWASLVRRNGARDQGTPDAREVAMQLIARQELHEGGDQLAVAASIDPYALAGLQKDGLLRTSQENPFRSLPEFAHDEVRRYAVARLLLATGDLTRALMDAGVPRWTLGAARLACQAMLVAPDGASNPVAGRFVRWQRAFDELVAAGHGERWTDVPGEALLTLGDPRPVLREAWPQLQQEEQAGVQRLIRLVDQRLRGQHALVRFAAVEPLVELLLKEETPWRSSEGERTLLVEWLRSLAVFEVPAGYALRKQLRARLLNHCAAADERLREAEEAQAAAQATITDEQRIAQQARMKNLPNLEEIGYPRSRPRRQRPAISREITNETVVELLALLGPDLGADGEALLKRIADAAPENLAPALEGAVCGRALAGYRQGFLADMVLAYYLNEEEDGVGGHDFDEGVRRHKGFGFGMPLAAWYRGPFVPMFRADFRNGVVVLNRLLNHAATVRARKLTGLDRYFEPVKDSDLDRYRTELDITGAPHSYVGDSGTWNWYRGTGVGPYPCMSALQGLERVCDEIVELGVPLDVLISMLLDGCDNVAMVALVVGVLVRHLDEVGTLLDRFLAEPDVWHFERARVAHERGLLAASSEEIVGAERRGWPLPEVAMSLVLAAGPERAEDLRLVGQQLVEKVGRRLEQLGDSVPVASAEMELGEARAWASNLDRSTYAVQKTDHGFVVKSHPPAEATAALSVRLKEVLRSQESTRLAVQYHVKQENGTAEPITTENLVADLNSAVTLLDDPSELDTMGWDASVAVAAYALIQHLMHELPLPDDSLKIAADMVLRVGEGDLPQSDRGIEESYFSQGADRSAARALPLLLIPVADHVCQLLDGADGTVTYSRAEAAVIALAHTKVLQTKLFLARGLDNVWATPCTHNATCSHRAALRATIETMRECVLGPWNIELQKRFIEALDDPVVDTLPAVADDKILVSRLDAAIRGLGPAAVAGICVSGGARALLDVLLDAQRRALLAHKRGTDHRGTHSLVAARALLTLDDDDAILSHIDAYIDSSTLLDQALRALSAAAEESEQRAETARRIWPHLVARVIDAHDAGRSPFKSDFHGNDYTLAALLPTPTGEVTYLHSEVTGKPIVWWDPISWQATVHRWLQVAGGKPTCVDNLIQFMASSLPTTEQARIGVPWVARAVLTDPGAVANSTYTLTNWLIEIRTVAGEAGLLGDWQGTVDALVVAGDTRLAPYSE